MSIRWSRISLRALYPVAGLVTVVAVWQGVVASGLVPNFLLPTPARVSVALFTGTLDGSFLRQLRPTVYATLLGYLAGSFGGFLLATLIAESRMAERFLLLHVVAIQSIPKVAFAPLTFLWLGFDISGKILLVALVCFPPVFANTLSGLRAVDPNLIDLLRASGASKFYTFIIVKLPSIASALFAGLEVAMSFALIGCVVMEFVGATRGMGFLIQDSSNSYDLPMTFASILILGVTGLFLNWTIRWFRNLLLFWELPGDSALTER